MTEPTPLERDLADVRARTQSMSRPNQVVAEMYAYATDLRHQGETYARAKTFAERRRAAVTLKARAEGEKSATICTALADEDEQACDARVAYRLAEQMVIADREALKMLHAELDKLRTEAADRRAADSFTAREQT